MEQAKQLRNALLNVDVLADEGLMQISALAGVLHSSMQAPGADKTDALIALEVIRAKALDIHNCIDATIEETGARNEQR